MEKLVDQDEYLELSQVSSKEDILFDSTKDYIDFDSTRDYLDFDSTKVLVSTQPLSLIQHTKLHPKLSGFYLHLAILILS